MTPTRATSVLLILLSGGISIFWGVALGVGKAGGTPNFRAIYYGARCLIKHADPYEEREFLRIYEAEGGTFPSEPAQNRLFRRSVPICVNLPTTLLLVAPLALLPWAASQCIWLIVTAAAFTLAAFLTWDLARERAPGVSLFLICLLLANSEVLFTLGNTAGIAVSLAVVAVWCFFRNRMVWAGIACLAISLALKPHDSGLVWLYLLWAGGALRKRAFYALIVTVTLTAPAILWVSHAAPGWRQELRANLAATSAHGDISDPGPDAISRAKSADVIVDLQTVVSVFRDEPGFYNPAVWLICGVLLGSVMFMTLRPQRSHENAWLALAAVAPLTMLITYHRPYDAKLLLLAIPACAALWAEGRRLGRIALVVTGLAITFTADLPLGALSLLAKELNVSAMSVGEKLLSILVLRPAPLFLLAMAIFYLSVCFTRSGLATATARQPRREEVELA